MARLIDTNGTAIDVPDDKVGRLLAAGFKAEPETVDAEPASDEGQGAPEGGSEPDSDPEPEPEVEPEPEAAPVKRGPGRPRKS